MSQQRSMTSSLGRGRRPILTLVTQFPQEVKDVDDGSGEEDDDEGENGEDEIDEDEECEVEDGEDEVGDDDDDRDEGDRDEDGEDADDEGEDDEVLTEATTEVRDAAAILLNIRRDSTFALRRLKNQTGGKIVPMVNAIIMQSATRSLHAPKSAEEIERDERDQQKRIGLDAALTLISLSGQSRADSKVALALVNLRRECSRTLSKEGRRRAAIGQHATEQKNAAQQKNAAEQMNATEQRNAAEQKNAAERLRAFQKFHNQYPDVLRTTSRMSQGTSQQTIYTLLRI